ncbi:arginine/serine-rich protein PNISR [Triplophysa dalaica]|uniref:arginine/serine-rich protein PNISR n=1 Tax=Triplophysa dalaica TaxID=1582913 RepID=UPI0024E01742|nr:arginine/serine-rich protein PNISR [Triplophysa dalaica]
MWDQGGQPWPQWPLGSQQQWMQSFQHHQDPGQVDWAALAQAWIAQKESSVPEPPSIQPNGQDMQNIEPPARNNHGSFPGESNFGRGWQPEWGMHSQPPPPPPEQAWIPPGQVAMDVINPSEDSNSQDSLEFPGEPHHRGFPSINHGFGGQPEPYPITPMAVNQFDYQHGAAPTGTAYGLPSTGFHAPFWPDRTQNRTDRLPAFRTEHPRSPNQLAIKPESPTLDAVKRRTLPAWIREGLEKMDREKQKKLEKERMEKERAEMANNDSDMVEEGGDGHRLPRRSKFDSDDEDGEEEDAGDDGVLGRKQEFGGRVSPPVQEDQSEPEMTEEEKEFQLMFMTKTLLTEVLLEVTNEEIQQVAKETHRKASKAPAKQLAQSNALASLTGLGGLGEYGSDESEDEERSAKGSDSSDTDDEELLHRIHQKQDAFRRKEKEQQERLALEAHLAKEESAANRENIYEEEQSDFKHKQEVREKEAEPVVERRRSRSEPEVSEVKWAASSKEHSGRNGGSASPSPSARRSRTSSSNSSSSRSSSSSSSPASSRSSSHSSSPRRKRRRSRSTSRGTRRRSRSRSSRRHQSRDKGRDRRRSSRARSSEHSSRHRKRSRSRQRRSSRGHRSRSKTSRSRSRDRRRSRDHRHSRSRSTSRSRRKQKASSRDRERRKERSRSHEKDKRRKDKDLDKKKDKQKGKEKETDSSSVREEEDGGKSRKKKEIEHADSRSEKFSRQDSKSSKKGSAKSSRKYSDSESSRSRSLSPEVSKEKKSKKSKRSRSRSTERSHKSGKKASRKHKSKSRSRSTSPSRRKH